MGDIARLSSAMLSYARDFMIDKGFTYCIPPFMIRSDVVTGVMSFEEMDAMMYKIEGEDLYLIGTSEHSMIGKFKDQIVKEEELPITLTSYSHVLEKKLVLMVLKNVVFIVYINLKNRQWLFYVNQKKLWNGMINVVIYC